MRRPDPGQRGLSRAEGFETHNRTGDLPDEPVVLPDDVVDISDLQNLSQSAPASQYQRDVHVAGTGQAGSAPVNCRLVSSIRPEPGSAGLLLRRVRDQRRMIRSNAAFGHYLFTIAIRDGASGIKTAERMTSFG